MKLKEIKPGMAIHCKNDEEKKALLEEAERLGYRWFGNESLPTDNTVDSGMTIHFYDCGNIAWSNKTKGVTEFSDLILPELTAEEVLSTISEICENSLCGECYLGNYCNKQSSVCSLRSMEPSVVIDACIKWKSDHEKKEPEIETVDICRIIEIQPDGKKRCVHEEDLASGSTDAEIKIMVEAELKRYCMDHDGEFIAVEVMRNRDGKDKGRIKACERELKRRNK